MIELINEIIKMKSIYRQGWLDNGIPPKKCESIAEHSFMTAVMAWFIAAEYYPKLDRERVMQLAIIHDMGEIYAGDITPNSGIETEKKHQLELGAIRKLFSKIENGKKFVNLWLEFEEEETEEAKFVKQIDKLEMLFQTKDYEKKFDVDLKGFVKSVREALKDTKLKEMSEDLLNN